MIVQRADRLLLQTENKTFAGLNGPQDHQQIPRRNQGVLGQIKRSVAKDLPSRKRVLANWDTIHHVCKRTKGRNMTEDRSMLAV